jgi:hypothetical protein
LRSLESFQNLSNLSKFQNPNERWNWSPRGAVHQVLPNGHRVTAVDQSGFDELPVRFAERSPTSFGLAAAPGSPAHFRSQSRWTQEWKAIVELYGDRPKENVDYSRIINAQEVKRLASLIDPEKVVTGGNYDEKARYFDPTILYPAAWSDKIMQDEIFGPILPVLRYSSFSDVIATIKGRPRPLAGFIFSQNQRAIDKFISSLSFGGGAVNQSNIHVFIETMPFGGVGASGMGYSNGKHGFDSLTHAKAVLVSPPDVSIDHLFPPFTMDKVQALSQWLEY